MNRLEINNNKERIISERIIKEVACFSCDKSIEVKFVNSKRNFSLKNNWNYWTEQTNAPEKYICSSCLRNMYYRDYLSLCKLLSPKKRQMLKNYFVQKLL